MDTLIVLDPTSSPGEWLSIGEAILILPLYYLVFVGILITTVAAHVGRNESSDEVRTNHLKWGIPTLALTVIVFLFAAEDYLF